MFKKIEDRAYVINLDEYCDVGAYWIVPLMYFVRSLLISVASPLNSFLKRLSALMLITTPKKTYLEYKYMIQQCADIFPLDLLTYDCKKDSD